MIKTFFSSDLSPNMIGNQPLDSALSGLIDKERLSDREITGNFANRSSNEVLSRHRYNLEHCSSAVKNGIIHSRNLCIFSLMYRECKTVLILLRRLVYPSTSGWSLRSSLTITIPDESGGTIRLTLPVNYFFDTMIFTAS